jgi:hypothetical protein
MKQAHFKTYISVMTAIVTVLGAMTACFATFAVSDAREYDFSGLDALIRAQKADIVNHVYAYEHYRAYTTYVRYNELGSLLYDPDADQQTAYRDGMHQRELWGAASGISEFFFKLRYLDSNGKYDLQRELKEEWAQDSSDQDLNPDPYFKQAEQMRKKSSRLTANMIVLAISFWFFTVAQTTEKGIKYLWAALGMLAGLAGAIGILIGSFAS